MASRERYRGGAEPDLDAANVLVLCASLDERCEGACARMFDAAGDVDAMLHVTLVQRPVTRLRRWRAHADRDPPERVGVVGLTTTGKTATERIPVPGGPAPARVEWVTSPPDLTRLWVAVLEFLDDWGASGDLAVCLHSLTVLLQYADPEQAFRFCHAFSTRVRQTDATAHYHLDPGVVDDTTVATLRQLFDRTVAVEDGGLVER